MYGLESATYPKKPDSTHPAKLTPVRWILSENHLQGVRAFATIGLEKQP